GAREFSDEHRLDAWGRGKYLERADHIKRGEALIQQEGSLHHCSLVWGGHSRGRAAHGTESRSVVGRAGTQASVKGPAHRLGRAKTTALGDSIDGRVGIEQSLAGDLDSDHLDKGGRCHTDLMAERTREMPWTHAGTFG